MNRLFLLLSLSSNMGSLLVNFISSSFNEDEIGRREIFFQIYKSLFDKSGSDFLAYMNSALSLRDRSETLAMLQLWQMLLRDTSNYAVTNDDNEIFNIDFSSEIKELSKYFNSSELSILMAEAIKNCFLQHTT